MHEALIRLSLSGDKEYVYSQDSGRAMAKKILKFIKHAAYEAAIEMAKELGPFPAFKYGEFIKSKFMQQLLKERPDLKKALKEHGIANVTVLTQAPTGTTGTVTGYSSGCEPYFAMAYLRNSNVGTIEDGCPSFRLWLQERDIDYSEYSYNLKELRRHKRVPKYFEEAQDISWEDHLAMQAVFAEQIDSSVSKTINLPSDATVEDIMGAYIGAYDMNIKSTAVYRDGSKTQILETLKNYARNSEARPQTIVTMQAPRRPDTLDCNIHAVSVKGDKWKLLVGLFHGKPYEIFCFPEEQISIPASRTEGKLKRNGHGRYNLIIGEGEDAWTIKNVAQLLLNDEHRMITRLLSTSLRHGAPLSAIVSQLSKCDGDVTTFSKALLRVLKKYITDEEYLEASSCRSCGSKKLVMEQGCMLCTQCGFSGCD
jgi:ribonucleoside-diphosphate reductase alpha chain